MFTRLFGEISKQDADIAGGKGASLGEMTQAGIPVPPGFVVLAGAFEHFLEETDLNVEIDNILHGVDHSKMHTVEHASETIQSLILKSKMPADIAAEALADFRDLGAPYVAVRSSATAEDSASAAWAGQLDSFLNTTEETLLRNIQRCWASLFTPRAIFYRFEQGLHESKISVAVVVQKMVASEVSGIAFSVHPVTEDRNQLIIEAGFGLGEAIVSGQITPDSYVVEKSPRRIIDKNIADQARGIYRKSEGGNEWIPIPQEKRNLQKLSGEQILELSDFILRIEQHYGFPCDIEWAYEDGKFYIVQSRPITTLDAPTEENIIEKDLKFELTFKEYHPPLWLSLWINDEYLKQYRNISGTDVGVFYIVKDDQFEGHIQVGAKNILYEALKDRLSDTFFENLYDEYSMQMKRLYDLEKELEADRNYTAEELIRYLEVLSQATAKIYPMSNALYLLSEAIEERANGKLKESGFDTSVSAYIYPKRATYLGQHHVDAVALKERYFKDTQPSTADVENLRKSDPSFGEAFSAFAAKYAYLTALNLGKRTPESFIPDIASAVHTGLKREPVIPSVIQTEVEYLSHILFFKDEISTYVVPYTKFAFERLWDNCAQTLRCSIAELQELHIPDIQRALRGEREGMKELMDKRRQATLYFHVPFDDIEISEGDEAVERVALLKAQYIDHLETPDQNVISGKIGCHGYTRGVVKIIRSSREIQQFQEGQVLVTEYTAPEFVPAMKKALAVVTDTGGATSHAAIVSRELGVPCVVGTKIATQVLHDGDLVEVDADHGVVRVLEKQEKFPAAIFEKTIERDTTFVMQGFYATCLTGDNYLHFGRDNPYTPVIIHYTTRENTQIWENKQAMSWFLDELLKENSRSEDFMKAIVKDQREVLRDIQFYWEKGRIINDKELNDYLSLVRRGATNVTLYYYSGLDDRTPQSVKDLVVGIRKDDEFFARNDQLVRQYIREKGYSPDLAAAVLPDEMVQLPGTGVLQERMRNGVVLIDGAEIVVCSLASFIADHPQYEFLGFSNTTAGETEVRGQIAYKGKVQGRVKILRNRRQIDSVQEGDVIVSPMTTPDFIVAMQKAAAFVTDEGGIVCHAAIIAREMKKPCIIGTKIATQVLHDGDLVEVDADNGVVRILERADASGDADTSHLRPITTLNAQEVSDGEEEWNEQATNPDSMHAHTFKEPVYCTYQDFEELYKKHSWIKIGGWRTPLLVCDLFYSGYSERNNAHYGIKELPVLVQLKLWNDYYVDSDQIEKTQIFFRKLLCEGNYTFFHEFLEKHENALRNVQYAVYQLEQTQGSSSAIDTFFTKIILFLSAWEHIRAAGEVFEEWVVQRLATHGMTTVIPASLLTKDVESDTAKLNIALDTLARERYTLSPSLLRTRAEKLVAQYAYLNTYLWTGSPYTVDDMLAEVQTRKVQVEKTTPEVPDDHELAKVLALTSLFSHKRLIFINGLNRATYEASAQLRKAASRRGVSFDELLDYPVHTVVQTLCEGAPLPQKSVSLLSLDKDYLLGDLDTHHFYAQYIEQDLSYTTNLRGKSTYPGKVTGIARIIMGTKDFHKMQQGDVLVCSMTDPNYVPLMKKAKAIVTDMGGILCHAAIISREFRVPCVIGTEQGSHVLHDGDLVEVDADHGMVRVILSQASFGGSKLKKVVAREYVPLISDLFIQAYADLGTYQKIFLTDYYVRSAYVSGTYNYGPDATGFGEHLYEKSKNEKGYFDTMFTNIYRYGEEVYDVALALSKRDYRDMKKGDVLKLAREFFERYKIFSISLLGFYLESPIEKALRKIAQRAGNPDEALSFLSFPEKENLAAFEQENLYKIGAVVVAEEASSYAALSDQAKRLLVQHADEYGWINARGGLDESWSPQDIYDRIVGMDIDFEKESVENIERKKKHSVESEKYLQRLNLSGEEKEIVRVAKELVYFRTYRTDYLNRIISTARPLLRAVADVYDMSLKDLMRLRVAEILDGTIPTKEAIENRKKDYFLATVTPGSTIFTADQEEIARLKEQYIDQPAKGGEVRGTVAFKGKVQGRVRLVVRRKDFDGVLEGDVLVTAMTTPDMMTIMKKAIAFVTDEGGVTCHAAIIAREMRKPCIIGTKIATQVLHDGDLVEVDADSGVVRVLERS